MKLGKNLGMKLLAIFLIAFGASPWLSTSIPHYTIAVQILAIIAGVLLLMGR
ncbi:MAG TPA: hypothetical protein VKX17_07045 [Planctomycetota bacterium]|nr:hypothetical protein [Planctomycetota bacterium]